jgi:hypothetical protein
MKGQAFELADIIKRFGRQYIDAYRPNAYILRTLDALLKCRTAALGGHKYKCGCCAKERISYNSCRNRHCPKCQAAKQAFWAEDRMQQALKVKHYHIVFTVPHELNAICLLDSKGFYSALFQSVWDVLRTFGYSHYGVESGAICVLHTWGQNLGLHLHIHCIVPAAGFTLAGNLKRIGKKGKFLYPVLMLSPSFRRELLRLTGNMLKHRGLLTQCQPLIDIVRAKNWVVDCEPSFGSPGHIVKYLAQYTHRVAISNQRLINVDQEGISFMHKDYRDKGRQKPTHLAGVEFLRRFCMHILPYRFVKIRYYGIYANRFLSMVKRENNKIVILIKETTQERLLRLTGFDMVMCPFCKKGPMVPIETLPRIRSPNSFIYDDDKYI